MVFPFLRSSAITIFTALLFLCVIFSTPSRGQNFQPSVKKINATNVKSSQKAKSVAGKLHVIAVMVAFQEDENRFTTGTGTFDENSMPFLNNRDIRIDPLPHNREYFEAHLEFAKRYFETMSNGVLEIDYTVIPEIVKLSGEMSRYSPTGRELDFLPVAEMAAETWSIVNGQNLIRSVSASETETAFVIFHAGSGRDIELVGTTLTKTPQDIPSLYLSTDSFRNIFGDPAFEGFPLIEAETLITNTLILPRTLSRPGEDITGNPFVLQLSLNGLLSAQIGSHLGLPDLFDTESGRAGIGRFGLMDGAGIFSYNGIFPPEMSAWEKAYLGWIDPLTLPVNSPFTADLPAVSLRQNNSVLKAELSKSEYFLIENRHRDPDNNGVTIEIQRPDGSKVSQTFTNSDRAFTFQEQGFEELLEPGVVTAVSDYDFSLPGGLADSRENSEIQRELNGGILIWHIDENVIESNIASNTINTGPGPKGVNLMEADGAQDIGNPVSNGLFDNNSNGWAFDFWWSGNDASVITQSDTLQIYQNRFGPDTTPDNSSNSGAAAGFELYDFSDNLPVASFSIRPVNPYSSLFSEISTNHLRGLSILPYTPETDSYWQAYPLSIQPVIMNEETYFILPGSDGTEIFDPNRVSLLEFGIQKDFSIQQPLWNNRNQQLTIAENPAGLNQINVESYRVKNQEITGIWKTVTSPNYGFISESEPGIIDLDHSSEQITLNDGAVIRNQEAVQNSERIGNVKSCISQNQLIIEFSDDEIRHSIPGMNESKRKHTGVLQQSNGKLFVYLLLDDSLLLFAGTDDFEEATIIADNTRPGWPAFGDLDNDGITDILYVDTHKNSLQAKTITGATLPYFPISATGQSVFLGTPLLSDLDGDGEQNIILQTKTNSSVSLTAYDNKSNLLEGFPLLIGGTGNTDTIHPAIYDDFLIAVSPEEDLKLWKFPNNTNTIWSSKYGNGVNNKVSGYITVNNSEPKNDSFLISDETYNWPNPAIDFTNIRFLTSESASIDIVIITASGRSVFSESTNTEGNITEEILVDTSKWASGAYFARIKAKSTTQTAQKTLRIAITK